MHLASFGLTIDRLFARSLNVLTRHRPANPRLGVRVWPGLDKPNPYPYPAVPGGCTWPGTATRDNPYILLITDNDSAIQMTKAHPLACNCKPGWASSDAKPPTPSLAIARRGK